jgi:hypothetical protein
LGSFDASQSTQHTVGEFLSLNRAVCFSTRLPHTCSIVTNRKSKPAISKSEFDIVPSLFNGDTKDSRILSGHANQKTAGGHADSLPCMTPPTPWLNASLMPMKSGHPETSWRHRVDSNVDLCNRVRMPSMADLKSSFLCRKTCWGCNFRIALHGDMRAFPANITVNTQQVFAIIDWNSSNGMPMLSVCWSRAIFEGAQSVKHSKRTKKQIVVLPL